jgi:hypothetical protein
VHRSPPSGRNWDALARTQVWIDVKKGVALIMMIQRSNFKNGDDSPVRLAFQKAVLE